MSEDIVMAEGDDAGGQPAELRGCPYCGTLMDPRAHRCTACCGHTGIAWGTVHKEHWLFVFCSVLIAVGCLASWNGRSPAGVVGDPITGLDTIRGTIMLAIAAYGLITGVFNILYRRMVLWPFVLNAFLALWVGLGGLASAYGGTIWKAWSEREGLNITERYLGGLRAVPPGFLLLAFAGILIIFRMIAGILSAAGKGKAKAAPPARKTSSMRRREAGIDTGADTGAGEPPPTI
ncbi:MAG TPA: hypothetical protein VND21_00050 [Planctomycetota bacterium]|jgi:hypothetical protein|nr:hypothetical protein [Planctomycetota bacterium]